MKKFKDFLYDKNDILIAIGILLLATLVIVWRINAIMDYPSEYITDDQPADTTSEGDGESGDGSADNGDAEGAENGNATGGSTSQSGSTDDLWSGGVTTRDVEVQIGGSSASAAIQQLVDVGLFDDYADYQSACTTAGLDHEKVSAGNFTFPRGSSKTDIARAVNWG